MKKIAFSFIAALATGGFVDYSTCRSTSLQIENTDMLSNNGEKNDTIWRVIYQNDWFYCYDIGHETCPMGADIVQ